MGVEQKISEQEHISFNNVQIQIVLAPHTVASEREFSERRKAIEEKSQKFFKRGFSNVYFQEEGGGDLYLRMDDINNIAKTHRSYRTAFWHIMRMTSLERAKELTSIYEENPYERFIRSRRKDGINDEQIQIEAFMYAGLTAIDSLVRKGF